MKYSIYFKINRFEDKKNNNTFIEFSFKDYCFNEINLY